MLGGGNFESQNKVLPGFYVNFINASRVNPSLAERGFAAMPFNFDFGVGDDIMTLTAEDFEKNSKKLVGYSYDHESLRPVREVFKNAHTIYAYRLNGNGAKATNQYATAVYPGKRGNDIKIVIQRNVDENDKFDFITFLGDEKVDTQTVSTSAELISNGYINPKTDATLAEEAGVSLSGGSNSVVTGEAHLRFLELIEGYAFNCVGCPSDDPAIISLYVEYQKRMREEYGVKFQTVVYRNRADYEGVVNEKNIVADAGAPSYALIYWVTGARAGCALNSSLLNRVYDGEYTIDTKYTQAELKECIKNGEFVFHKVGNETRVLKDISSLTTLSETKGVAYQQNQTISALDDLATQLALVFNNTFMGKVPNDNDGRITLQDKFYDVMVLYNKNRVFEAYSKEKLVITKGEKADAVMVQFVDPLQVTNVMGYCYSVIRIA